MKPVKVPRDHTYCSHCDLPYSFIKCRVTLRTPYQNVCLKCAVELEEHGTLGELPANLFSMDPENVENPAEETTEATDETSTEEEAAAE